MADKSVNACQSNPSHALAVLSRRGWPFLLFLFLFSGVSCSTSVKYADSPRQGPVVILGDSLAAAYELKPEEGFVALLSARLNLDIVNLGKKGATTGDSVPRVDKEVLTLSPSLVILELGGNDALQKVDPATTVANFQAMIDKLHQAQVPILILGVRGGLLNDKYEELFEELVSKNSLAYVPNILEGILSNPSLRIDNVHPNAKGHTQIADRVEPVLRKLATELELIKP